MVERTRCCVPGCRRTTATPFREWVCGKHWTAVDKALRQRLAFMRRRMRKAPTEARWRLEGQIWKRCVEQAIERAMGI